MLVLDTSVAIPLRDGNLATETFVALLADTPAISAITLVELEGGVWRDLATAQHRVSRLELLKARLEVLPFGAEQAIAYGQIVRVLGFSRPRIIDRMIAATAILAHARLVTSNPKDFADIPGLDLEAWPPA